MIAIVSLGLPSTATASSGASSATTTSSSSKAPKRTDTSIASVKETLCVYDGLTGSKLASHRMEGNVTAGLTADLQRGIYTSRQNKATTASFAFGKEQPQMRFAAPEPLEAIQFSSDALYICAGGGNGMIYVWETETGQMLAAFKAHYRKVTTLRFSEDDSLLVSGGEDAMVHFWDFTSLLMLGGGGGGNMNASALLRTISTCKTGISQVAVLGLAGTTSLVAIASQDHTLRVVPAHNGTEIVAATLPSALLSVCIDLDNVYAGAANGQIYVIKAYSTNSSSTHVLSGHEGAVTCVQCSPNRLNELISGSEDGSLRWWDVSSLTQLRLVKMEGACPVRGLVLLNNVDYANDLVKRKRKDTQPLKKLKEAEQWDRLVVLNNTASERAKLFWESEAPQANTSNSNAVSSTAAVAGSDKWELAANRLSSIASSSAKPTARAGNKKRAKH